MRILYVAPLVAGFRDILEGKKESKGLPSFILPLKYLLETGNEVNVVLVSNYNGIIDIRADWIGNENILANVNNDFATARGIRRYLLKAKSFFELYSVLNKTLRLGDYDFVYCHGTAAFLGNLLANRYKVRCGYRIYGVVNLAHDIEQFGVAAAKRKHAIYYKIFNTRKEFILITDDGTDGDYAFKKFNPNAVFPAYYLVNGIDKSYTYICQRDILDGYGCKRGKYIFHAGRISRIKRQDRVVQVLHELHKRGHLLHLLLSGHISDTDYYEELRERIRQLGLNDYVHFIGAVERASMQSLSHDALATVLLGDSSNQGNIFFECAFSDSVIITYPENSLKKYIVDKESGLFVNDEKDAADKITEIIDGKYDTDKMRDALKITVSQKLMSWEERVKLEVDLIYGGQEK